MLGCESCSRQKPNHTRVDWLPVSERAAVRLTQSAQRAGRRIPPESHGVTVMRVSWLPSWIHVLLTRWEWELWERVQSRAPLRSSIHTSPSLIADIRVHPHYQM